MWLPFSGSKHVVWQTRRLIKKGKLSLFGLKTTVFSTVVSASSPLLWVKTLPQAKVEVDIREANLLSYKYCLLLYGGQAKS
jgi:hypothetical protein